MAVERGPYSEQLRIKSIEAADLIGYREVLEKSLWFTFETQTWLGNGDTQPCRSGGMACADVMSQAPYEYRRSVFIYETRKDLFRDFKFFGRGEFLFFLYHCITSDSDWLKSSTYESIFCLEYDKVAIVHFLPTYAVWQLHVRDDIPYSIDAGTRILCFG